MNLHRLRWIKCTFRKIRKKVVGHLRRYTSHIWAAQIFPLKCHKGLISAPIMFPNGAMSQRDDPTHYALVFQRTHEHDAITNWIRHHWQTYLLPYFEKFLVIKIQWVKTWVSFQDCLKIYFHSHDFLVNLRMLQRKFTSTVRWIYLRVSKSRKIFWGRSCGIRKVGFGKFVPRLRIYFVWVKQIKKRSHVCCRWISWHSKLWSCQWVGNERHKWYHRKNGVYTWWLHVEYLVTDEQ